jgi:hypothetical protein
MDLFAFAAIAIGLILGAFVSRLLVERIIGKFGWLSSNPKVVIAFAVCGVFLAIGPGLFTAFIVGGNFGGAWGEVISQPIHLT